MKKGFTIIELLVVVALITLLLGMGLNSYTSTRKAARDAKRKTDLKTIQNSIEQYYALCGLVYPTPQSVGGNAIFTNITCPNPSSAIMPTVPPDPQATPYLCVGCSANNYQLCINLEGQTIPAPGYCVSNQQ